MKNDFDFENFSIEPEEFELERNLHQDIINYGLSVNDFEVSPYESLNMLDLRDIIDENKNKLSNREKILLRKFDIKLLSNADLMSRHLSKVYDFNYSEDIPLDKWWWHLNNQELISKIIRGSRRNRRNTVKSKVKVKAYITER